MALRLALLVSLSALALATGCGGDDDTGAAAPPGSASGGSTSSGGATGAGGAAQGGSTSKGGAAQAGGKAGGAGAAGKSAQAGAAGAGGDGAQAGAAGAGGDTAQAGAAGAGGDSAQAGAAGAAGAGGDSAQAGAAGAGGDSAQAGAGGASAGGGQGGATTTAGRWLMAYYPAYQAADLPVDDVRFDLLSHLAVGAVLPQVDGSIDTSFYIDTVNGPALADALVTRAHGAGKKAILMVGGAGAHEGFVGAASPGSRAAFVDALVGFAKQHGFDGLDLDWEPLPPDDLDAFAALVLALRAAWPDATLTLPVGPLNINFEQVDPRLADIASSLDQINLMTYSMAGAYDGWKSWHHTPLHGETGQTPESIASSVDAYLAAGVPAGKLGIGEGFYGLCYTSPVTAPMQELGGASAIADDNQLSYRAINDTYLPMGTRLWDDTAKAPYLTFSQPTGSLGCTYLSYVDEEAIAAHTDYVRQKGLGGAIVWTVNEGHLPTKPAEKRDPLLEALWSGLSAP